MGNDGLDTNDGGGAAGGKAGGGKGGSTSTGGAGGGITCGPVCEIFCEFGNVTDSSGCPTCSCNAAPKECSPNECPPVPAIAKLCPDGSAVGMSCKRGTNGKCGIIEGTCPAPVACKNTECGPVPPVAPCPGGNGPSMSCDRNATTGKCGWNIGQCVACGPVCLIFCEFGNVTDASGCPTCSCNPGPVACTEKECGPGIKAPTRICEDGSTAGPVCGRDAIGKCGWSVTSCPASCSDSRELKTCELNTKCQWLEPGCSGNKLSVAGCFPKSGVNCETDKNCVGGKQCVTRTVDHCAMRPNLKCITCASPINVCL